MPRMLGTGLSRREREMLDRLVTDASKVKIDGPKAAPAAKVPNASAKTKDAAKAKAKATKAIPDGTPGPKSVSDMFRL